MLVFVFIVCNLSILVQRLGLGWISGVVVKTRYRMQLKGVEVGVGLL